MPTPESSEAEYQGMLEDPVHFDHEPDLGSSHNPPGPPPSGRTGARPLVSKRVVVFDPGDRRTGVATACVSPGKLTKVRGFVMDPLEAAQWFAEQQRVGLQDRIVPGKVPAFDIVVYETWIPRLIDGSMDWIKGNRLLSAQSIGMIRQTAILSGAKLRHQGPGVKKAAFRQIESGMPGTAILKRRIHSSTEQHDKDALAHLWRYYVEHWRNNG